MNIRRSLAFAPLLFCAACATPSLLVEPVDGAPQSVDGVAAALATKSVVFLGELHDKDEGHRLEFEMVRRLHAVHQDLIVSMEMFERDVQPVLDAYLAGRIGEAEFLANSRPWKNYREHYRPIVEYARAHGLQVVAANMPTELARKVAREGPDSVAGDANVARSSTAPRDAYYQRFVAEMSSDADDQKSDWVLQLYQAQCFKDDTMAESILAALTAARGSGRQPLVVHVCGAFHSDFGQGTVARLRQRAPEVAVGTLTMRAVPSVYAEAVAARDRSAADYVLLVRADRSDEDGGDAPHTPVHTPTHAPAAKAEQPAVAVPVAPAPPRGDTGDRPALGFMPDYGAAAVQIADLVRDGPAEHAGLEVGDVIESVDGVEVPDMQAYMLALSALRVGDSIDVVVRRSDQTLHKKVQVGSR